MLSEGWDDERVVRVVLVLHVTLDNEGPVVDTRLEDLSVKVGLVAGRSRGLVGAIEKGHEDGSADVVAEEDLGTLDSGVSSSDVLGYILAADTLGRVGLAHVDSPSDEMRVRAKATTKMKTQMRVRIRTE